MTFWILVGTYTGIALVTMRVEVVHLAWQPLDDSQEVADEPDWRHGLKWGIPAGLLWWVLLTAFLLSKLSLPPWPRSMKLRFERAHEEEVAQKAHEERCKELDVPII